MWKLFFLIFLSIELIQKKVIRENWKMFLSIHLLVARVSVIWHHTCTRLCRIRDGLWEKSLHLTLFYLLLVFDFSSSFTFSCWKLDLTLPYITQS